MEAILSYIQMNWQNILQDAVIIVLYILLAIIGRKFNAKELLLTNLTKDSLALTVKQIEKLREETITDVTAIRAKYEEAIILCEHYAETLKKFETLGKFLKKGANEDGTDGADSPIDSGST